MSQEAIPPALQQLIDRQQIHDCILRYCSGVDRFDREMLLSVYHPDAMDDHGAFVGAFQNGRPRIHAQRRLLLFRPVATVALLGQDRPDLLLKKLCLLRRDRGGARERNQREQQDGK